MTERDAWLERYADDYETPEAAAEGFRQYKANQARLTAVADGLAQPMRCPACQCVGATEDGETLQCLQCGHRF
ncbi:hypothetical protein [Mycolicibacterium tusciae]|uniref:hypothetical protein n=1 Tax=Mycolicibacterium tusciae TaxID=75922 RepID=UPI0009F563D3|nr:hypothetical protein [Mycolicibacterium tusciae]